MTCARRPFDGSQDDNVVGVEGGRGDVRDIDVGELVEPLRRNSISATYFEYWFVELVTMATGPPGPWSGGGGAGAAVVKSQLMGDMVFPAESLAFLTVAV